MNNKPRIYRIGRNWKRSPDIFEKKYYHMKFSVFCLCLLATAAFSQQNGEPYTLKPLSFGVVMDHPDMKKVTLKPDVTYFKNEESELHMDVYLPPGLKPGEKRPAIVFLNAIGDQPGSAKVKSWGIYTSWPTLMAAHGYIGISMEAHGLHIQQSLQSIFDFISKYGNQFQIDADRLGVYAASANVLPSSVYLMGPKASSGIKAAVLYYGQVPRGPFRKDLPVYFMVSEGDVQLQIYDGLWSEVLKNKAPWTIRMGSDMPHAFDAYWDRDESRRIIRETIAFWKNNLDPVPQPAWGAPAKDREALGMQRMNDTKSLELFGALAAEHPEDPVTLSFYALGLERANRHAEVETVYRKILSLKPTDHEAAAALAGLYVALLLQNKTTDAEQHYKMVNNSSLASHTLYANMGYKLLVAGKDREAAHCYESALSIEPRPLSYYNLGCAYAKQHETMKALDALEKAAQFGYDIKVHYEADPDLNSLRGESRYKALLEKLK